MAAPHPEEPETTRPIRDDIRARVQPLAAELPLTRRRSSAPRVLVEQPPRAVPMLVE